MMFATSREQTRQFFRDAWRKRCAGLPLDPLETLVGDLIAEHPEYHTAVTTDSASGVSDDPSHNPFLHLGLHLALVEQLQTDRPSGVRAEFQRLCAQTATRHLAEHRVMSVLADILWEAQQRGTPPDQTTYLTRLRELS